MNPQSRYFVRVGAEVRGPYEVGQLRQLAEVDVITPAHEVATAREGPWQPAGALAQQAEIFPPRSGHAFKPTEYSVINDAGTPPLDFRDLIAEAQVPGRVLRPSHPAELAAHHAARAAAAPNEVEAMVRAVQAREAQFAPPPPPPPKWKPGRRLMLIAFLAVLGNVALAAILTFYDGWNHPQSLAITAGLAVIYNGGMLIGYYTLPKE